MELGNGISPVFAFGESTPVGLQPIGFSKVRLPAEGLIFHRTGSVSSFLVQPLLVFQVVCIASYHKVS
jgi:hypothetical protein